MSKAICVFSASSNAVAPHFFAAATELGALLAQRKFTLVYGGGKIDLMGALAAAVHQHGGRVVGVIPHSLRARELAYEAADELIVTRDLRERKAIMEARADVFVALPGGFGTLEEALEILTLKQLQHHAKPLLFLNTQGFFENLVRLFDQLYAQRFATEESRHLYHVAATPCDALDYAAQYQPPVIEGKWL